MTRLHLDIDGVRLKLRRVPDLQGKFARMIWMIVPPLCAPFSRRRAAAAAISQRCDRKRSRQSSSVSIASAARSLSVVYPTWQIALSPPSTMQKRTLCLARSQSGAVCSSRMKAMAVCPVNLRARDLETASAGGRTPTHNALNVQCQTNITVPLRNSIDRDGRHG